MPSDLAPSDLEYQERTGTLLRRHRDRLGLTTADAATRISETDGRTLSRSALTAYELGKRPLTLPMLQRIANAYGLRPRDLVPETVADAPAYADVTVRVRLGPGDDLDAVEQALVRATEETAQGGRVVAGSAPFLPEAEPIDVSHG